MRGTTRDPAHAAAIAETGAEPYIGDPDRIATLMDALHGVTVVCWLMGTIPDPDLHAGRLRMLWEKLVDTPVRGVVYEGAPAGSDLADQLRDLADPAGGARRRPARRATGWPALRAPCRLLADRSRISLESPGDSPGIRTSRSARIGVAPQIMWPPTS